MWIQIATFAAAWLAVSTITAFAIGAFIRAAHGPREDEA